ncbi:MAG: hypothetical protein M1834_000935 [Cirrosporium novae-zelandiae]|nr:MAG: hypothetical protein M1834_000935 [Cirrosporium novae-zelandiae]
MTIPNPFPYMTQISSGQAHDSKEVEKRNRDRFLCNAASVIRSGSRYTGRGFHYCEVAQRLGLKLLLERAILNYDILISPPSIRRKFVSSLLFIILNQLKDYNSTSAVEILAKDEDGLLSPFREIHSDLSDSDQRQIISLVRLLLELCGGQVEVEQHYLNASYLYKNNEVLYGSLFGIKGQKRFGEFNPEELYKAISRSNVFTGSEIDVSNLIPWSTMLMVHLHIGYQTHFTLPPEVLEVWGTFDNIQFTFYKSNPLIPCFQKPENEVLLLLTSNTTIAYKSKEALSQWVVSEKSQRLYNRLIEDLQKSQETDQLVLTMAALLCYERLRYPSENTKPMNHSYLNDLDAVLKGKFLGNKTTVFERITFALSRVLYTCEDRYISTFLSYILYKTPLLHILDGYSDQYWAKRIKNKLSHSDAFSCFAEPENENDEMDWVKVENY